MQAVQSRALSTIGLIMHFQIAIYCTHMHKPKIIFPIYFSSGSSINIFFTYMSMKKKLIFTGTIESTVFSAVHEGALTLCPVDFISSSSREGPPAVIQVRTAGASRLWLQPNILVALLSVSFLPGNHTE